MSEILLIVKRNLRAITPGYAMIDWIGDMRSRDCTSTDLSRSVVILLSVSEEMLLLYDSASEEIRARLTSWKGKGCSEP